MSADAKTASAAPSGDGSGSAPYPDLTSPTDSVIEGEFGAMSAEEQEKQRDEWKAELAKTEEEIHTLRQVLASKEAHAAGLKRRLGITAWREFSEDMTQGLRHIQDSQAYKKSAEMATAAREKTATMWSSMVNSQAFQNSTAKAGTIFGAAKSRISSSLSQQQISGAAAAADGPVNSPPVESAKEAKDTNGSDAAKK